MLEREELRKMSAELVANPEDYMSSFRRNLFRYIDRKEITLAEVAELADMPLSTLRSFMYGDTKDCYLSMAVRLAKVFDVSVDELVGCGTISPQTCESLQLMRQLPESFTHFVRWAIHYHYDLLASEAVTKKAIEVMLAEEDHEGNMEMTNRFEVQDISALNDEVRPKVFMGIRIPNNALAPRYFKGNLILLANDRQPKNGEDVVICVGKKLWILRRQDVIQQGVRKTNYYSIVDGRLCATEDEIQLMIGYIANVQPE